MKTLLTISALLSVSAFARVPQNNEYQAACFVYDGEGKEYLRYADIEETACDEAMKVCKKLSKDPVSCFPVRGD